MINLNRKKEILEEALLAHSFCEQAAEGNHEILLEYMEEVANVNLDAAPHELTYISRVCDFVIRMRDQGLFSHEIASEFQKAHFLN